VLDRFCVAEHEKRLTQEERSRADRHLLFLHRLEQRRLDFGGRAIDFVGEDEIRE